MQTGTTPSALFVFFAFRCLEKNTDEIHYWKYDSLPIFSDVVYRGALQSFRVCNLSTLPPSSTSMNTTILLLVTGHCTCQPGAAENTDVGSQFQVGCV